MTKEVCVSFFRWCLHLLSFIGFGVSTHAQTYPVYGDAYLDIDTSTWDFTWYDQYNLVVIDGFVTLPDFTAPSGDVYVHLSYKQDSLGSPTEYLIASSEYEVEPGKFYFSVDFWGVVPASVLYMGALVGYSDINIPITYAEFETPVDSMIEVHLPQGTVTDVSGRSSKRILQAYPNPFTDKLKVETNTDIMLLDVLGNTIRIYSQTEAMQPLDMFWLSPGAYLIRDEEGAVVRILRN